MVGLGAAALHLASARGFVDVRWERIDQAAREALGGGADPGDDGAVAAAAAERARALLRAAADLLPLSGGFAGGLGFALAPGRYSGVALGLLPPCAAAAAEVYVGGGGSVVVGGGGAAAAPRAPPDGLDEPRRLLAFASPGAAVKVEALLLPRGREALRAERARVAAACRSPGAQPGARALCDARMAAIRRALDGAR